MKKSWRLWSLLSVAFVVVLLVVTSLLYGLILYQNSRYMRKTESQLLLDLGQQLAIDPQVQSTLEKNKPSDELEKYTVEVAKIHRLDFAVVMNMQAIRLTHPDEALIGKHFKGGDEASALKGKNHLSVSHGTLGESLRGFVPVFSKKEPKKQIGVVALGIRVQSLSSLIKNSRKGYTIALLLSITSGIAAASALAYYLKQQLHSLEPQEISRLFEERNAMLDETKDVVAVVDLKKQINLANIAASELFQRLTGSQASLIGQPLNQLILDEKQVDFSRTTEQLYRQNGQDYLFSAAPIIVNQKQIGWIVFLRNATESLFVMDQLANTTAYASALQSQSHEFMNKLHVIYGLADLQAYDELKIYLDDILSPEKEFSHRLSFLVQNPQIAGFLIGERLKFSERKTQLMIEITPEIPENQHTEETKGIIDLYRYLHHSLLQFPLGNELTMTIHYEADHLTTRYLIYLAETERIQLREHLTTNFFQQMLLDRQADLTIEVQAELLTVQLKTSYHEVKP
ncbi:Spo0B domain-containing protein [Enterococcus viikkiensis]